MDADLLPGIVGSIPPGAWMSYGDVARAAGGGDTHARSLNGRFTRDGDAGRAPRPEVRRHGRRAPRSATPPRCAGGSRPRASSSRTAARRSAPASGPRSAASSRRQGRRARRPAGRPRSRAAARASPPLLAARCSPAAAPGRAPGTFRVSQCNAVADGGLRAARPSRPSLWWVEDGWPTSSAASGGGAVRIGTANWRLPDDGEHDRAASACRRSHAAHHACARLARLALQPAGAEHEPGVPIADAAGARLLRGPSGRARRRGAAQRRAAGRRRASCELTIWCSPANGPGWCNWPAHLLELRGLTARARGARRASASAAGAARRRPGRTPASSRSRSRRPTATPASAAWRSRSAASPSATLEPAGGCRDDRLPPCPQALRGTLDVDTRRVPDGARRLRLVVTDAAGNARTVDAGTVTVANQPPRSDTAAGPRGPAPAPPGGAGRPRRRARPSVATAGAPFPPNPLAGRGHVAERPQRERARLARARGSSRAAAAPARRVRRRSVDRARTACGCASAAG